METPLSGGLPSCSKAQQQIHHSNSLPGNLPDTEFDVQDTISKLKLLTSMIEDWKPKLNELFVGADSVTLAAIINFYSNFLHKQPFTVHEPRVAIEVALQQMLTSLRASEGKQADATLSSRNTSPSPSFFIGGAPPSNTTIQSSISNNNANQIAKSILKSVATMGTQANAAQVYKFCKDFDKVFTLMEITSETQQMALIESKINQDLDLAFDNYCRHTSLPTSQKLDYHFVSANKQAKA